MSWNFRTWGTGDGFTADLINAGKLTGITIESPGKESSFKVRGGDAQFKNGTGQWLNLLPTGIYGYDANGDTRFQADQSLVTSSAFGTSVSNVYLAAKESLTTGSDGEARVVKYSSLGGDGLATSYKYLPIRADGFASAPGVNMHLVTDGEVRVTSSNGGTSYRDLRANGIFSGFMTTTTTSMWLGTDSTVHIVSKDSIDKPANVYKDLRADNLRGNAVVYTGTNGYVGVDNEFRVVNIGLSGVYRNVRAGGYYGSFINTTATNMYVGATGELRVTDPINKEAYKPVKASAFNQSSSKFFKKSITDYKKNATDLINGTKVHEYWYNEDDENIDKKHIGIVVQEAPMEVLNFNGGDSVDLYAMVSLLWKSNQELSARIKKIEEERSFNGGSV